MTGFLTAAELPSLNLYETPDFLFSIDDATVDVGFFKLGLPADLGLFEVGGRFGWTTIGRPKKSVGT